MPLICTHVPNFIIIIDGIAIDETPGFWPGGGRHGGLFYHPACAAGRPRYGVIYAGAQKNIIRQDLRWVINREDLLKQGA